MDKSYSELIRIPTFEDRIKYLMTNNRVGEMTFGYDRIFNQIFYKSGEWKNVRHKIIVRDNGCDLAMKEHEIGTEVFIIHHINPIMIDDLQAGSDKLFDPENLVLTTRKTHTIIHFGFANKEPLEYKERTPNDMCPWKH